MKKIADLIESLFSKKTDTDDDNNKANSQNIFFKDQLKNMTIYPQLENNLSLLKKIFAKSGDVNFREFSIGAGKFKALLVTIDGLSDKALSGDLILNSSMIYAREVEPDFKHNKADIKEVFNQVRDSIVGLAEVTEVTDYHQLTDSVLYGDAILLLDGCTTALSCSVKSWEHRTVSEPDTEVVVRGPREGFNEVIRINTSLVRRRLRTPNLVIEERIIGEVTHTSVAIGYIKGIVNERILEETKRRLNLIKVDSILESNYISEMIVDNAYSPFPQIQATERPDKVAASLLEGRIAIFVDGTPFVLIIPAVLAQFMQAAEDYYQNYYISTFVRILRYAALILTLLLPALYIAVTTYHPEILPTAFLISIAAAREGVPFPAIAETLLMLLAFEALREAGIRLPKTIGQTISIVGALIIGDAAVSAGIVSPAMVIVVAITGISSFIIPVYELAIPLRLLNYPLIIMAATLGLFGIMTGFLVIVLHLISLSSFGVPYTKPFAPLKTNELKDTVPRVPWWEMFTRPEVASQNAKRRQKKYLRSESANNNGKRD